LKNLGRLEEAQKRAELEVARAEASQNLEELAEALFLLDVILDTTGQYAERENILYRAINTYDELNNLVRASAVRNNLADVYRLQGKFEAALIELHRGIKDLGNLENEALPYLLETLGDVQLWQRQPDQASLAYRRAIAAAQRLGLSRSIPRIQFKLVGAMLHTHEHRQALSLLEVIETPKNLEWLRAFMEGLAVFETQPEQAIELFTSALTTTESDWLVRISILRAELIRRIGKLEQSHALAMSQALKAHGFETALLVDLNLTTPTLQFFLKSGWLPESLGSQIQINQSSHVPNVSSLLKLEIRTLGIRSVSINDTPVIVHLAKSFEILVFLARNGPSSRDTILEAIWNSDSPQSQRYFKVAVRRLRSDLSAHPAINFDVVPFNDQYAIASSLETHLDLNQLEVALGDTTNETLEQLLLATQGEFLSGIESEWVDEQRMLALEYNLLGNIKLGIAWLEDRPAQAAEAFRRALVLDPFHCECLVHLVTAMVALKDQAGAKLAIERFRSNLNRELGIDLDVSTRNHLEKLGF
jgi:LuxR family transcriptional regulator, maltose regulon positive regulatory protein